MAQWWQLHHLPKLHVCCCNVALDSDRAGNINRLGHVSAGVDPDKFATSRRARKCDIFRTSGTEEGVAAGVDLGAGRPW